MRLLLAACLMFSIFACTGCGGGGSAGATPEATFDSMKSAAAKKDWAGMIACTTVESQDELIGGMAIMYQLFGAIPGQEEKMKGARDILTKHGVNLEMAKDASPVGSTEEAMKALSAGVKDKVSCAGELVAWVESNEDMKKSGGTPSDVLKKTLSDVKIEGDVATGKLTSKMDGKELTEEQRFKKVGGKWYADMTRKSRGAGM